jgi:hypothetical protein
MIDKPARPDPKAAREAALAKALRANLKRRKAAIPATAKPPISAD